jgi:hypothetical protein
MARRRDRTGTRRANEMNAISELTASLLRTVVLNWPN